jgi:hypothetical protein
MAIKTFKEILNNKGYRISKKDREIFEEGTLQSFFGFSSSDLIEFVVYDINDNQLPLQINPAGDTTLVKYIPLTTENIKNYFLIAEGTTLQLGNFPKEYFIDGTQLLKDSGYDAGIFKTQITLLNRRAGDYRENINAKLWIKEISPSRTEIKVLPQRNNVADSTDLRKRVGMLINGSDFRDDVIPYVFQYINQITPDVIDTYLKQYYTSKWFKKLNEEFNIKEFDRFSTRVHKSFIKAVTNEFQNKISNVNDANFGKKKPGLPSLELSVESIEQICLKILVDVVNKELPRRQLQNTEVDVELDRSFDKTKAIIDRRESDLVFNAEVPQIEVVVEKPTTIKNVQLNTKIDNEIKETIPDFSEPIDFVDPNPIKTVPIVPSPPRGGGGGGFPDTREYFVYDEFPNEQRYGDERFGIEENLGFPNRPFQDLRRL